MRATLFKSHKWGALAIGGVLLISLATPVNAAVPKAGASCIKKNATATSAGKLYTCILSGKKLVWNKGVALPKPKPSPTPTPTPQSKNFLASDSRITSISDLTDVSICKTEDITPEYRQMGVKFNRNGFPRPELSIAGKKLAKVLVIPMSFNDLPFDDEKRDVNGRRISDIEALQLAVPKVIDFYRKLSNQKFDITIEVLPSSEWWHFNTKSPFRNAPQSPNSLVLLDLINEDKSPFKFENYDVYVFLGGYAQGYVTGTAGFGEPVPSAKGGELNTVLMVGAHFDESIWVHEFGHALFGLEDLYLFNQKDANLMSGTNVPVAWDLMASNRQSLLRWNRLLMGWLPDKQVRCITDQKSSVHYLSKSEISDDPQLLTINISPGVTLAAEVRSTSTQSHSALVYIINTHISHGQGPIQVQKNLLNKGQSLSWLGWKISILDGDDEGMLLEVVKTDIDKFVPPAQPTSSPSGSQPPSSKLSVRRGDILPNGFLKGLATWEVSGHQSYRLYVTAVDDFQKVYFETGYVNDSSSPLKIEINGLVCNKELRTITEFYTEKDGKGEQRVIESKQLSNLSCEDTTKKP